MKWKFHLLSCISMDCKALWPIFLILSLFSPVLVQDLDEIWCVCLYKCLFVKERMASHSIRQFKSHQAMSNGSRRKAEHPECTRMSWCFCAKGVPLVTHPDLVSNQVNFHQAINNWSTFRVTKDARSVINESQRWVVDGMGCLALKVIGCKVLKRWSVSPLLVTLIQECYVWDHWVKVESVDWGVWRWWNG